MSNPTLEIVMNVRFEETSRRSERADVLADVENGVNAILDTGQNTYSGDGAFYNLMEGYGVSVKNRDTKLQIDIDFESGTTVDSIQELADDLIDSIELIMTEDVDLPERKCYESVYSHNVSVKTTNV